MRYRTEVHEVAEEVREMETRTTGMETTCEIVRRIEEETRVGGR
jgi:hypothetical protein